MEQIYDLIIIGSGPAGLGAAIYAKRAELKTLVIEREMMSGGQVLTTYEVDNYAGLPGIGGFDLGMKFREHADKLGVEFAKDTVLKIEDADLADENEVLEAAEAGAEACACDPSGSGKKGAETRKRSLSLQCASQKAWDPRRGRIYRKRCFLLRDLRRRVLPEKDNGGGRRRGCCS